MIPARYTPEVVEEYTRKGYWRPITFSHFWDRNAILYPDKEALVDSRTRLTWAEAKRAIDRMALGLVELGIKRDEVVLVQLPMCVEQLLLRQALEKAGIIHLPVLRSYRHKEMEHLAGRIDAVAIFAPWHLKGFDHLQMIEEVRSNLPGLRYVIVVDVVPKAGETLTFDDMASFLKEKGIASYKLPERLEVVEELPLVSHGSGMPKIDKKALLADITEKLKSEGKISDRGD